MMVIGNMDMSIRAGIDRSWRFIATTILYLGFGIGGLLNSMTFTPLIVIFSTSKKNRIQRVRWLNHISFKIFVEIGMMMGVFTVRFNQLDTFEQLGKSGQLIIANHPSLLDVVFLLAYIPNANCVVQKNKLYNPVLAMPIFFAGYILNNDGAKLLTQCQDCLERGESVIFFPEGTRTIRDQKYKFKRGATHLMLLTKCQVRPVFICCKPAALEKYDPWYKIPKSKITYVFTELPPLKIDTFRVNNSFTMPMKVRYLNKELMQWYNKMNQDGLSVAEESPVL